MRVYMYTLPVIKADSIAKVEVWAVTRQYRALVYGKPTSEDVNNAAPTLV